MSGTISTRHLFTHALVIVREFGLSCFVHCVWRSLTERAPARDVPRVPRGVRGSSRRSEQAACHFGAEATAPSPKLTQNTRVEFSARAAGSAWFAAIVAGVPPPMGALITVPAPPWPVVQ